MPASRLAAISVAILSLAVLTVGCGRETATVSADCKPKHEFDTTKSGELVVGVTEIPPFSYTENGEPAGLDFEIIKKFAEESCKALVPQPVTYAAAVPSVQSARIDLTIGDWYRTADRAEEVGLTAPLYTDELSVVSESGVDSIEGLLGKSVGTVDGYLWVSDLRALLGDKLKVYPSSAELKQDFDSGRLDVAVDAYGSSLYSFGEDDVEVTTVDPDKRVAATLDPAQVTFPYTPDNKALGEALDAFIADLHESGELVQMLEKFGLPASAADVGEPRLIE